MERGESVGDRAFMEIPDIVPSAVLHPVQLDLNNPARMILDHIMKTRNEEATKINRTRHSIREAQEILDGKMQIVMYVPEWISARYPIVLATRNIFQWEIPIFRELYFAELEHPKQQLIDGLSALLTNQQHFHHREIFQDLYYFLTQTYQHKSPQEEQLWKAQPRKRQRQL